MNFSEKLLTLRKAKELTQEQQAILIRERR